MKLNFQVIKGQIVPYSQEDRETLSKLKDGAIYCVEVKQMDQRTIAQNRLIHQFCKNISNEAKKQNFKLKDLVKDGTEVSMLMVKELMFKRICNSLYGKDSTTKLNKDELNLIFDTLILYLGMKGLDTKNILREDT